VPLAPLRCALVTSGAALIVLGGGAALASTGPLPRLSDAVALVSADGSATAPDAQALRARHQELSEQLRQLEAAVDAAEQTSGTPRPASTASDAPRHPEADTHTATGQSARTTEPEPAHAAAPSHPADRSTTRTAVHVPDQATHPWTVHEPTHASQPEEEEENEKENDDD